MAQFGNNNQLYPMMLENPEHRWAFIRKVYVISSFQMLITTLAAATVVFSTPSFFTQTAAGLVVCNVICILPFIILFPLYSYRKRHPWNYSILILFMVSISCGVGLAYEFTKGRIILDAAITTCVAVVSLTLCTFWEVKRGKDFSLLGPFLFASLLVLIVFGLIQIFIPLGKISVMIYKLAPRIFCCYLVYDTDNMIKRYLYDDYIWAAVALYLDVLNIFLSLLNLLDAAEC